MFQKMFQMLKYSNKFSKSKTASICGLFRLLLTEIIQIRVIQLDPTKFSTFLFRSFFIFWHKQINQGFMHLSPSEDEKRFGQDINEIKGLKSRKIVSKNFKLKGKTIEPSVSPPKLFIKSIINLTNNWCGQVISVKLLWQYGC